LLTAEDGLRGIYEFDSCFKLRFVSGKMSPLDATVMITQDGGRPVVILAWGPHVDGVEQHKWISPR
jgi:hypothetical protein